MRVVQKSEIRAYRIPIWRSPIDNSIGMRLWVRNGLFRRGWLSIIRNFSAHCAAFCAITKLKSKQMHQDQTRHKFANSKTIYIQTSHTEYPLLQLTQNHSAFSLGLFNTCLVRRFCKWTKMQKKKNDWNLISNWRVYVRELFSESAQAVCCELSCKYIIIKYEHSIYYSFCISLSISF